MLRVIQKRVWRFLSLPNSSSVPSIFGEMLTKKRRVLQIFRCSQGTTVHILPCSCPTRSANFQLWLWIMFLYRPKSDRKRSHGLKPIATKLSSRERKNNDNETSESSITFVSDRPIGSKWKLVRRNSYTEVDFLPARVG